MGIRTVVKMLIGSAVIGLIFSILYHSVVIKDFQEYDQDKSFKEGSGEVTFVIPDTVDQYYLKYRTSGNFAPESIAIYVNGTVLEDFRVGRGDNLDMRKVLPVDILKPGSNKIKVLKNGSEEEVAAADKITLKNSRRKAVQGNLFILFKSNPVIPSGFISIIMLSLWGWLIGFLIMVLVIFFSVKLLSYSGARSMSKLVTIDFCTYIFPILTLLGLYISHFFCKYYLIITSQFFWFAVIFLTFLSKIIVYVATAYRKAFFSGVALIAKKSVRHPVNSIIVLGLFLLILIPLPGLIYPYFPISDAAQVAERDSEIFANIAYVLLLIGAILKFVKDYRKYRKEKN